MTLVRAVRRVSVALLRLQKAQGDRARRNARSAFLQAVGNARKVLDAEYPVERRIARRSYLRACTCNDPFDEHIKVGKSMTCSRPGCPCTNYTERAGKLKSNAARIKAKQARGYEKLVNGAHIPMCAELGIKIERNGSGWWAPAWINELPTTFYGTPHFTKAMAQRAKKSHVYRKELLARLGMLRRQGVSL